MMTLQCALMSTLFLAVSASAVNKSEVSGHLGKAASEMYRAASSFTEELLTEISSADQAEDSRANLAAPWAISAEAQEEIDLCRENIDSLIVSPLIEASKAAQQSLVTAMDVVKAKTTLLVSSRTHARESASAHATCMVDLAAKDKDHATCVAALAVLTDTKTTECAAVTTKATVSFPIPDAYRKGEHMGSPAWGTSTCHFDKSPEQLAATQGKKSAESCSAYQTNIGDDSKVFFTQKAEAYKMQKGHCSNARTAEEEKRRSCADLKSAADTARGDCDNKLVLKGGAQCAFESALITKCSGLKAFDDLVTSVTALEQTRSEEFERVKTVHCMLDARPQHEALCFDDSTEAFCKESHTKYEDSIEGPMDYLAADREKETAEDKFDCTANAVIFLGPTTQETSTGSSDSNQFLATEIGDIYPGVGYTSVVQASCRYAENGKAVASSPDFVHEATSQPASQAAVIGCPSDAASVAITAGNECRCTNDAAVDRNNCVAGKFCHTDNTCSDEAQAQM